MRTLWRGIVRTLFWSYERGSWPYDVMIVAILIFVLVTPRRWFNDEPQTTVVAAQAAAVQLLQQDDAAKTRTYRLNASALAPNKRAQKATPELEEETHEILGRTVDDLKGRTFQVSQIDPVRGDDGSVEYYDVSVKL
ncbi:MAG: hypothetical protein WA755_17115 [Candidatus Acidiferrales bacterium]